MFVLQEEEKEVSIVSVNQGPGLQLIATNIKRQPIPVLPSNYNLNKVTSDTAKQPHAEAYWAFPKVDTSYTKDVSYGVYWASMLAAIANCKDWFELHQFCSSNPLPILDLRGQCNVHLSSDMKCEVAYNYIPDNVPMHNPWPIQTM